jgi:putative transposase
MPYNPNIHHRRSIRLNGYDYSQAGLYFITICVQNREHLFGKIENGKMILNDAGRMVENEWLKLTQRFANVHLHEHVVMPNHFHAIMEIIGATLVVAQNGETVAQNESGQHDIGQHENQKGQPQGIAPTETIKKPKTVGDMVGAFQSIATVEYIRGVKQSGWQPFNRKLWQRNYWEHIIRDEQSYQRISQYIINNPKNWGNDKLYIQ